MCRALILASTSNYLNCAYRSYCTVHFSLESYTLSSCLPAALAAEISTLGNFVLHNKYCTWGMFLSKNVWTERKTAFQPIYTMPFFSRASISSPIFYPSSLAPGEMSFLIRTPLFLCQPLVNTDCSVILQLLVDRTVHPLRKLFLSAFLPINWSDCFMSPKTTALKAILWNFGTPSLFFTHHSHSCVKRALFSQPYRLQNVYSITKP